MDIITIKHWVLVLGGIFLLCISSLFLPRIFSPSCPVAEIYQDGVLIHSVSLTENMESVTIPLSNDGQENTILAEKGSIRILSANCPDKLCVHQGAIQKGAVPIVCLPHRLVIQIKNNPASADAVSH